jgi:hypothetical protein
MAREKRANKWDGKWIGFMDIPLTAELKEQVRSWDADGMTPEEQAEYFVRSGYKLTANWNEKNQAILVSVTGQAGAGKNAGYTLSAHAKTFVQALHVLLFKHVVLSEEDWHKENLYQPDEDFG